MSTTVTDYATPVLKTALEGLTSRRPLLVSLAGAVKQTLRGHFRMRQAGDSRRKRKGWESRYFWSGSRGQSVEEQTQVGAVTRDTATVVIASSAFAQKLHGGTITPKRGKYLALPLRAEAYAAGSPREWDNATLRSELRLVLIRSKRGTLFLAQVGLGEFGGAFGASGIRAQYLLVRKVEQKADANALPPQATIDAVIDEKTLAYVERRLLPKKIKEVRK